MKLICVVAAVSIAGACQSSRSDRTGGSSTSRRPTAATALRAGGSSVATGSPRLVGNDGSGPIACKRDRDCPRRACGPCKPGEVFTRRQVAVQCAVNPCTNSRSICNAQHVCAVHPDTRRVDDVQAEACRQLWRDKWALCKGKEGSALQACENTIDAATARDDENACKVALARVRR